MHVKVIMFASVLVFVGLVLFFYGASMTNQVMNPEILISGTYLVVLGIFLGIVGFLMLMLQLFQRHTLIY